MKNTLEDLVARNVLPDDDHLLKEIEVANLLPRSFLGVINFTKPDFEYVGPTCQAVTGYSRETFLMGGTKFVFSMTTEETALIMVQNQFAFSQQAKEPGFDPRTVRMAEHLVEFNTGFGHKKKLMVLGLPLTYTVNNDMAIGIALHPEVDDNLIKICKQRLTAIKERHNQVYHHASVSKNVEPLPKVFFQKRPEPSLTTREEEILKLMAKGLTSSQISAALHIAESTVETHRKNLFQKLEVKNVAELIKKASKLYWLE